MASSTVNSNKSVKRMQSRKSHSWWWDSHISPKNSKWLAENLEEMDQSVKRMLKLIEEDGDSFAKKAEMYYQRRPELVSHVEEFYRMYRSLAERYDHVTGELRKNIPSDLQSQGSGISDVTSEPSSTWPSPAHDQRLSRHKSGPRAAGFEFFLGSGGSSSDLNQKEGDESSTLTDSESESDDSSVNNYSSLFLSGNDQALSRRVIELEIELREMKEKLRMQQDENGDGLFRGVRNENSEDLLARIAGYERELKVANERIRLAEEEASRLKIELKKQNSLESMDGLNSKLAPSGGKDVETRDGDISDLHSDPQRLGEQLKKISSLQDQLALAHKDINTWKTKLNAEKREVSKLQERISRLKTSLSDRDHEIRELKTAVSDAEQNIFPEKAQIKAKMSKLLEERTSLEEQLREWESRSRALEDEIRMLQAEKTETESKLKFEIEQLKADIAERDQCIESLNKSLAEITSERDEINAKAVALKAEVISRDDRIEGMNKHLNQLHMEHAELIAGADKARKLEDELRSKAKCLEEEVERQKIAILEGAEEKREAIRQLCFSLEHYRNGYQSLRRAYMGHKRLPVLAT